MFRTIVYSIFVITAVTAAVVPDAKPSDAAVNILVVDDISKFKDFTQGAKLIPIHGVRETKHSDGQEKYLIRYTLGIRMPGDSLLEQTYDTNLWSTQQNVQADLVHPGDGGEGAIITHVQILVEQTYYNGNAYVVEGGIGQRRIRIIVEAFSTYTFNYIFSIYGI